MTNTVFNSSVFAKYFDANDASAMTWATNVLQKLYDAGIVPKYIPRQGGDLSSAPSSDINYIQFWKSITTFWSYLVTLARVFEDFEANSQLAAENLTQRGYYVSGLENDIRLIYILQNALRIRRERGTAAMYQLADLDWDSDSDSGGGEMSESDSGDFNESHVDGELLRLIAHVANDFFILGFPLTKFVGWNTSWYSPEYKGLTGRYDMNIGYEFTEDVVSLTKYPLLNPSYISIASDEESDSNSGSYSDLTRQVMRINISAASPPPLLPGVTTANGWVHKGSGDVNWNNAGNVTMGLGQSSDLYSYPESIIAGQTIAITINLTTSTGVVGGPFGDGGTLTIYTLDSSGIILDTIGIYSVPSNTVTTTIAYNFVATQNASYIALRAVNFPFGSDPIVFTLHTVGFGIRVITYSGIGLYNISKMIVIDPKLNYEITFQIRQPILSPYVSFGCLCYDANNNPVSLLSAIDGVTQQQNFFTRQMLNRSDRFYFIRGIVFNANHSNVSSNLNIGFGNHLKFPQNAVKIIPFIVADNSTVTNGILELWNVKVNVVSLSYSNTLLNTSKHVDVILKNNNNSLTRAQLYVILRKYFMPYNTGFTITHIGL